MPNCVRESPYYEHARVRDGFNDILELLAYGASTSPSRAPASRGHTGDPRTSIPHMRARDRPVEALYAFGRRLHRSSTDTSRAGAVQAGVELRGTAASTRIARSREALATAPASTSFRREVASRVAPNGAIRASTRRNTTSTTSTAARRLIRLLKQGGRTRLRRAIDAQHAQLETHPRTKSGNYWHKKIYPRQVWLDGLYMAQPFRCAYAALADRPGIRADVLAQFAAVEHFMRDPGHRPLLPRLGRIARRALERSGDRLFRRTSGAVRSAGT